MIYLLLHNNYWLFTGCHDSFGSKGGRIHGCRGGQGNKDTPAEIQVQKNEDREK